VVEIHLACRLGCSAEASRPQTLRNARQPSKCLLPQNRTLCSLAYLRNLGVLDNFQERVGASTLLAWECLFPPGELILKRSCLFALSPLNLLLETLPPAVRAPLLTHLEAVPLPLGAVLYEPAEVPRYVHFLTSGMASMMTAMANGDAVEVGLVSRQGMPEALQLLGPGSGLTRCLMQITGSVSVWILEPSNNIFCARKACAGWSSAVCSIRAGHSPSSPPAIGCTSRGASLPLAADGS
jgi:hypothetical protein